MSPKNAPSVSPEATNNNAKGCLGMGISFCTPQSVDKMYRRLEKMPSGWFFTGPYYGKYRRLYKHGEKDIRFVLGGLRRQGVGAKSGGTA